MLRSARHFSCTGIKVLTLHFYFEQIAVTITDKFSSIKAESPEMSRTIMAVINEAGGGGEGGGGEGGGANAVVSYQFNVKFIRVVPSHSHLSIHPLIRLLVPSQSPSLRLYCHFVS